MGYQRTSTPKFFVDVGLLARHHGMIDQSEEATDDGGLFNLNPQKTKSLTLTDYGNSYTEYVKLGLNNSNGWLNSLSYVFILGHKFYTHDMQMSIYPYRTDPAQSSFIIPRHTVNCDVDSSGGGVAEHHWIHPTNDGWCLVEFQNQSAQGFNRIQVRIDGVGSSTFDFGEVSTGWSYTMPHSPELSLELSYANESIKTQQTKGGHTLTNSSWHEPPMWLNLPQWMTNDSTTGITDFKGLTPATRRTWKLSFSYLDDTDILNSAYPGDTGRQKGIMVGFTPLDDTQPYQFKGIIDSFFPKL